MSTNYNGIITKVKAMESKLLTEEDFNIILSTESVPDAITYLREHTEYKSVFTLDENISHREQLEEVLNDSFIQDFIKLYKFSYASQRTFLSFILKKLEIVILKSCIKNISSQMHTTLKSVHSDFFNRHVDFNVEQLYSASSIEEFISFLSGSKYYNLFKTIYDHGITNLIEYETQLDINYYAQLWKKKDKNLSDSSLSIITDTLGREIDLLNIMWIYRCKKYYNVEPTIIINRYLIPVNYKLSKIELSQLTEAVSLSDFINIFKQTYYGSERCKFNLDNMEQDFCDILLDSHKSNVRNNPESMASIHSYLFKREYEIKRITNVIESIRYNVKR